MIFWGLPELKSFGWATLTFFASILKEVTISLTIQEVFLSFAAASARTWVNEHVSPFSNWDVCRKIKSHNGLYGLLLAGITMSS